jgi:hypothetical protein
MLHILFIGDIIGKPGRTIVASHLAELKKQYGIDFTIANAENSAGGRGPNMETVRELLDIGIDVLTSGNHIWDQRSIWDELDSEPRLLRPVNYPPDVPGHGVCTERLSSGIPITVINVSGRVFMNGFDCPFRTMDRELRDHGGKSRIIVADIHAEATSEKQALGWYLDGRVSAVIGTHTHVPTADERILPGGTAYITDVGMTGSYDSVIGVNVEEALERFLKQLPVRFEPAKKNVRIAAVVISVDEQTGRASKIERVLWP